MSTPITNFQEIAELRERLARAPEVATRVAARVAPAFSRLAREAYDAREGVDGAPFGPGVTLRKSGRLRARALEYTSSGSSVRASVSSVPYARYKIRFGILPAAGKLPESFRKALVDIAREELNRSLTGAP